MILQLPDYTEARDMKFGMKHAPGAGFMTADLQWGDILLCLYLYYLNNKYVCCISGTYQVQVYCILLRVVKPLYLIEGRIGQLVIKSNSQNHFNCSNFSYDKHFYSTREYRSNDKKQATELLQLAPAN